MRDRGCSARTMPVLGQKYSATGIWTAKCLVAISLPAEKRGEKGERKMSGLACKKELSRDVSDYMVTTQREKLFDDHI